MSDRIELRGLAFTGYHGVLPEERRQGQPFLVDITLETVTRAAAASDDLADTVDYAAVAAAVRDVVTGDAVDLIETLAQRIADRCLATDARIGAVVVAVHKPQAPVGVDVGDVVVTIRRERG